MLDIERIDPDRWRMYRGVRLAALGDAPYAFGSRLEWERALGESEWRERLERRTQFIALADGQPVGTVGARPGRERETELVSMWVAPHVRGMGLGDGLIGAVIDEARAEGADSIVLWVSEGNEPAERLYARNGFVRTGRTQPLDDDDPDRGTEFEMRRRERGGER
jgi:GNAT superfamily N-acetyltransferase